MKQYKYTLYKQDGEIMPLGVGPKKDFKELYQILNCDMIEVIPRDYSDMKGRYTLYGDEEGRFKETNHRNVCFKVLADGYDVVGDVVKEEVNKS